MMEMTTRYSLIKKFLEKKRKEKLKIDPKLAKLYQFPLTFDIGFKYFF